MAAPLSPQAENTSPPSAAEFSAGTRWVLPVTILGSSLGFIDGTVVNVALPAMQADLGSTLATMQWVINGYMLMLSCFILLGGALGDRYGRRRIFIAGLGLFSLASLACGFAPTSGWLIAARLVQGAGAAMLVPSSLAIIGASYPEKERGKAIGTWAAAAGIMTAIGPPLGGWLVDMVGWRAIFFINPPVAILAVFLALKLPVDRAGETSEPLDIAGSVLAVLTLGLSSYGLVALGDRLWTAGAVALVLALPAAAIFILAERRARAPMLPLVLFANRNFSGANIITVVLYAALSGALFMVPFLLVRAHGYSATASGAALLPFSLIIGFGSRWAGGLATKLGARLPLVVGPILTMAGYGVLAFSGSDPAYWTGMFPGLVLIGLGMTVAIPPLTSTIFDSAPANASGTASGINNAAARGGGLIAVAAIGLAFGSADLSVVGPVELVAAYQVVMLSAAVLSGLSAICAALMITAPAKPTTS